MSQVVVLTFGKDEVEVGTISEVVSLLGPACPELSCKANVAHRIYGFVASVIECMLFSADYESASVSIEVRDK